MLSLSSDGTLAPVPEPSSLEMSVSTGDWDPDMTYIYIYIYVYIYIYIMCTYLHIDIKTHRIHTGPYELWPRGSGLGAEAGPQALRACARQHEAGPEDLGPHGSDIYPGTYIYDVFSCYSYPLWGD